MATPDTVELLLGSAVPTGKSWCGCDQVGEINVS